MQILGVGLTVAGTDFTSGSNESLLDNPTSLALQGDRLYVADARNSRVMTWLVRPELLALDMPRRLSSIDETNSTDNMTGNTTGVDAQIVRGLFMAATDVLLETGGLFDCGTVVPQEADVVGGVAFQQNFFTAQVNATGDPNASQLFALISFTAPGQRQLCYCSTYDGDRRPRGCGRDSSLGGPESRRRDEMEFTQPLGILTLRGPSASVLSCAANVPCNITVTGVRLASDDVLQARDDPPSGRRRGLEVPGVFSSRTSCTQVGRVGWCWQLLQRRWDR
eukprot:g31222.t1